MVHDFENFPELSNSQMATEYFNSPHKQITEDFSAECVKVHDGDTITLRWPERDFDFPLRFLDINAPELNEGGEESRDWLKMKIEGEKVDILISKNKRVGKYGRLLGRVFYNGQDLGQEMLMLGLAFPFGADKPMPDFKNELEKHKWF